MDNCKYCHSWYLRSPLTQCSVVTHDRHYLLYRALLNRYYYPIPPLLYWDLLHMHGLLVSAWYLNHAWLCLSQLGSTPFFNDSAWFSWLYKPLWTGSNLFCTWVYFILRWLNLLHSSMALLDSPLLCLTQLPHSTSPYTWQYSTKALSSSFFTLAGSTPLYLGLYLTLLSSTMAPPDSNVLWLYTSLYPWVLLGQGHQNVSGCISMAALIEDTSVRSSTEGVHSLCWSSLLARVTLQDR